MKEQNKIQILKKNQSEKEKDVLDNHKRAETDLREKHNRQLNEMQASNSRSLHKKLNLRRSQEEKLKASYEIEIKKLKDDYRQNLALEGDIKIENDFVNRVKAKEKELDQKPHSA